MSANAWTVETADHLEPSYDRSSTVTLTAKGLVLLRNLRVTLYLLLGLPAGKLLIVIKCSACDVYKKLVDLSRGSM